MTPLAPQKNDCIFTSNKKKMKKLLTLVALLATFSSFGQQIQKWHKVTNYMSSSEMVWSQIDQKTIFIDNHDLKEVVATWDIILDITSGEGFITSGDITYRVRSVEIKEQDNTSMVVMNTYNETLEAPILAIASTIDNKFKLGLYVETYRKVYYFYE